MHCSFTRVMMRDSGSASVSANAMENSEIAEFFNGKSVFITGGAGFIGSVLTESILRCCPGVHCIYLLLREKKGKSVELRKSAIFQKSIFQTLKSKSPELLSKVRAVEGDITSTDLGIQNSVLEEIQEHVSVVFHCAALISFSKSLRTTIEQNAVGTENTVNFSRKLPKLVAFIYTSTAYSNCNRMGEIKEEIYKLNVPAQKFLEIIKSKLEDEILLEMQAKCTPPWPNSYTFSKAVTENFLNDEAFDIPIAIIRPSIVLNCWKGSSPGYVEAGFGLIDVFIGIGKGFIRVLYCDGDKNVDTVPVDGVVNALITAAWAIATKRMVSPLVVNYASTEFNACTWRKFITTLFEYNLKNPLPKMYQKPSLVMRKYGVTYWTSAIFNHYIPAVGIDAILLALGKKPKLTKLYKFYDLALKNLLYFVTNEWHFKSDNLRHLAKLQNSADEKLFPVDLTGYNLDAMAELLPQGAPFYQWETDRLPRKERLELAHRRFLLSTAVKWILILLFLTFIAFIFMKLFLH